MAMSPCVNIGPLSRAFAFILPFPGILGLPLSCRTNRNQGGSVRGLRSGGTSAVLNRRNLGLSLIATLTSKRSATSNLIRTCRGII